MHSVFRLFLFILWLFISVFSLFSFSARKDFIAEAVYVASASVQSKKNGWFEGSCGINLSEDFG